MLSNSLVPLNEILGTPFQVPQHRIWLILQLPHGSMYGGCPMIPHLSGLVVVANRLLMAAELQWCTSAALQEGDVLEVGVCMMYSRSPWSPARGSCCCWFLWVLPDTLLKFQQVLPNYSSERFCFPGLGGGQGPPLHALWAVSVSSLLALPAFYSLFPSWLFTSKKNFLNVYILLCNHNEIFCTFSKDLFKKAEKQHKYLHYHDYINSAHSRTE